MDQRVDNERRTDSTPGLGERPSGNERVKKRSWRETFSARRGLFVALAIGSLIVLLLLVLWWLHARQYETTDDAFIDTRTVQISAQVGAAIVDVPVTDNQLVEAGAELVRLDDRDYIAQRDQSKANVDNLAAQIVSQTAKVEQAKKQAVQAQAALTFAQQDPIVTSSSRKKVPPPSSRRSNIRRTCCKAKRPSPPRKPTRWRPKNKSPRWTRSARRPKHSWRRQKPICHEPSLPRRSPAGSRD